MESLAAGCLGTPHPASRVAGRTGDDAVRKLAANADRGTVRHQLAAARRCPGPAADAHRRQWLVLLLAQFSPIKSRQYALQAPALCIAEGAGPAAPGSHDAALYSVVRCRAVRPERGILLAELKRSILGWLLASGPGLPRRRSGPPIT